MQLPFPAAARRLQLVDPTHRADIGFPERTFGRAMDTGTGPLPRLQAVAAKIFAERGFHATSMRDLSRVSGMSLAGIYHYVRSKHELLFLIQDACFREVTEGAEAAIAAARADSGMDPAESRLRAFIRHHVAFFTGHMESMKVLSHEDDELEGTMRARIVERKRRYVRLLTGLLDEHGVGAIDAQVATYALFGMMNWIYTWYRPGGRITPDHLADELADLFLNGYVPRSLAALASAGRDPRPDDPPSGEGAIA